MATCSPSSASVPLLTVRAVSVGGVLHVVLSGELDVDTTQRFTDAVEHARKGDERKLLVDLAELTFVDAFGLCALQRAANAVTGDFAKLELRAATGLVAYVLRLCSLGPIPEPEPEPEPCVSAVDTARRRLRTGARRRLSIVPPQI